MNNKRIIEFGFHINWRIMEISEGVICRGRYIHSIIVNQAYLNTFSGFETSSETQGQMVGTRETARRALGQCLTRPVPNGRRCSDFWLVPENFCVFLPNQKAERRQPFGTGLVRHCPQGHFLLFFTFLRAIFFCRLDFPSPPLSAPGFPKMGVKMTEGSFCPLQCLEKDLKKLENFQHSELFITSRAQIVQNKACKMWKIAAKLSKFPLEFLLEACQQLNI